MNSLKDDTTFTAKFLNYFMNTIFVFHFLQPFLPPHGVAAQLNLLLEALVCTMLGIIKRSVARKTTTNNREDDI